MPFSRRGKSDRRNDAYYDDYDSASDYDDFIDDYYTNVSSRDDYNALMLLAVDDIVLHQHFLYGTTQDVGQPPAPICYKQNSR